MTVKEIIRDYLKANGFGGLFSDCDCACILDDLFPCDIYGTDCEADYKIPCPGPELCENGDGECEWHIGPKKPQERRDA